MKSHERVGIVPVPARGVPPVDHDHVRVRLGDQRVGERHPSRSRTDDQVIRVDDGHGASVDLDRPPEAVATRIVKSDVTRQPMAQLPPLQRSASLDVVGPEN